MHSLSVYIHIPFCIGKCRYCDFFSVRYDNSLVQAYLLALQREWELVRDEYALQHTPVQTLYIGGGTPSLLPEPLWEHIAEWIHATIPLQQGTEWTIECNPESFSQEKARAWTMCGVNRLTIGVQTLDNRLLRLAGRPHTGEQALAVLNNPMLEQFQSVGVDVIYGLPGQTMQSLGDTLAQVVRLDSVRHLSAYELTLHDGTPFDRHRRVLPLPDDNLVADMMEQVRQIATTAGFVQYEISNFARTGYQCRHNTAYWHHTPYIGLGASAHSFLPPIRYANVDDIGVYIETLRNGKRPLMMQERLTPRQMGDEMIFLGLRMADGINEQHYADITGEPLYASTRKDVLDTMIAAGFLEHISGFWRPTTRGMQIADTLAHKLT